MRVSFLACLVAGGLIVLAVIAATGPAWAQSGAPESAAQNVRESEQYERLVCGNAAFRERRIRQECGPITDPQLRASCLASFQCGPGAPRAGNWRNAPPSERVR